MTRTILTIAGVASASSLLLVDSAVKGTALLMLAAVAAIILRRDSAATRHVVWLLAIVATLAVPLLSATLPEWRVLPAWASIPPATAEAATSPPTTARPAADAIEGAQAEPDQVESPAAPVYQPAAILPDSQPASVTSEAVPAPAVWNGNWLHALPLVWAIGFGVLILRLLAARWLLWNTERQGTVIWSSTQPAKAARDPIVTALEAVRLQLGIGSPVTLLIHPDKTMPIVWGILRYRLLLPVAARHWSGEQLQAVLLHEVAHVKRRDTIAQLLAQIACAVHWFNPLVWFATWRLGVERERACDDLVLSGGVRPSAFAGLLLEVAAGLAPARGTQGCGLAMARQSSLEGRLVALLSENLNRRGVSAALAAIALVIAVSVAVPISMLRAAEEKPVAPMTLEPDEGVKLKSVTEQKLKWGEPVNGLRMALAWPPSLGEAEMGDAEEFYLVVQNVSQAAVQLTANDAAPNPRRLVMRDNGTPLSATSDTAPMPGDWLLQPREVAFLRLFQSTEKLKDGRTLSAAKEHAVRIYPQYALTAEMSIEKAPAGAWTGKLTTGETRGSVDVIPPKHKDAQALYKTWTTAARADGKIPGGVIALLGQSVTTFIKNNPTWETTPELEKMLPRFEALRDWTGPDAAALLDELAAVQATPISMALDREFERTTRTGTPLPPELANVPWGEPLANGLRIAWLLEPYAAEHPLNTPLKSRILIHNAGKVAVVFRTRTWHQSASHKARDAKGTEIRIESTYWTTLARLVPFRLAPDEFVELNAAGIGVGANKSSEDWQNTRVGSWIDAKPGDDVTFTPDSVPLSDWNEEPPQGDEPRWWLDQITARLARHLPLPADAEARKLLLYRVAMELFGTPVSDEINAAFVADREPAALDSLAKRLARRAGLTPYTGSLESGATKFRVLPADPDAAKKPRTASNPGWYTLGENIRLDVSRRPVFERIVNEATIRFFSPDPKAAAPGEPVPVKLPDGYNTWVAAWVRGGTVLWVRQKSGIRRYDFSNPAQVNEEAVEPGKVPAEIREALSAVLKAEEASKPASAPAAKPAATNPPASEAPPSDSPTQPQEPPNPIDGAQAKSAGAGELVFITRETQRQFPKLDAGDGVTLEKPFIVKVWPRAKPEPAAPKNESQR